MKVDHKEMLYSLDRLSFGVQGRHDNRLAFALGR